MLVVPAVAGVCVLGRGPAAGSVSIEARVSIVAYVRIVGCGCVVGHLCAMTRRCALARVCIMTHVCVVARVCIMTRVCVVARACVAARACVVARVCIVARVHLITYVCIVALRDLSRMRTMAVVVVSVRLRAGFSGGGRELSVARVPGVRVRGRTVGTFAAVGCLVLVGVGVRVRRMLRFRHRRMPASLLRHVPPPRQGARGARRARLRVRYPTG